MKPSHIFCDNKSIVVAACGINMIKKRSTVLVFYIMREVIAADVVKL